MNEPLYKTLAFWIDSVLVDSLPSGIAAFHFNLYDGPYTHDIQLIGAPTYDANDSDWACDDIFMSPNPHLELPHSVVGAPWKAGLESTISMLLRYMNSEHSGAARLKESQAVSVGFVDGDLHVVWAAA